MKRSPGTITFFMSIVYLVLVTFSLGMVEAYRLQYIYAKQEEIGKLALHNLKADYIGDIFEEYGLRFYNEKLCDGKFTLDKTLQVGFNNKPEKVYFQDFLYDINNNNVYHFPYFEAVNPTYKKVKKELNYEDLIKVKQDAILFARDRMIFSLAGDWLEKLSVWKKANRSKEWTAKKDNILKELKQNEREIVKLYKYLDGVVINQNTHSATANQTGLNYFNASEAKKIEKIKEISQREDIPASINDFMTVNQISAEELLNSVDDFITSGMEIIDNYYEQEVEAEEESNGLFGNVKEYFEKKSRKKEFIKSKDENKEKLNQEYKILEDLSVKYTAAIEVSAKILESYKGVPDKINKFLVELEDADISISIKHAMKREMETVLQQCDIENNTTRIGNFKYIAEKLSIEQKSFLQQKSELAKYQTKAIELLQKYEEDKKAEAESLKQEAEKETQDKEDKEDKEDKKEIDNTEDEPEPIEIENPSDKLKILKKNIILEVNQDNSKYYYPMSYADYREIKSEESQESLENRKQELENNNKQIISKLPEEEKKILNQENLPSAVVKSEQIEKPVNVEATNENLIDGLMKNIQNVTDEIVLYEYYFMVFSHFAMKSEEKLAISGYDRGDHSRVGEIEYILFGGSETQNKLAMISGLYLARIGFNVMALLSDPSKMNQIIELATSIAGWWSFGIGTVVLTGIIVGVWASLETSLDIYMLFKGERVQLIKTPSTWKTSIRGAISGILTSIVDEATEKTLEIFDEKVSGFETEINHVSSDLTDDLKYHLKAQVAEQSSNLKSKIETLDNNIRCTVSDSLKDYIDGKKDAKNKAKQELKKLGLADRDAEVIIKKTFGGLENKEKELVDQAYSQKIDLINENIDKAQSEFDKVIDKAQNKGQEFIKNQISQLGDEFKTMGKKAIKKQANRLKDKISKTIGKNASKEISGEVTKIKNIRDFISFSYVDYLHLFLYLDARADSRNAKWLRCLDLIQQNQQQKTQDFYILDCERDFQLQLSSEYIPTFLPFGEKGYFSQWIENNYDIQVVVEGGY